MPALDRRLRIASGSAESDIPALRDSTIIRTDLLSLSERRASRKALRREASPSIPEPKEARETIRSQSSLSEARSNGSPMARYDLPDTAVRRTRFSAQLRVALAWAFSFPRLDSPLRSHESLPLGSNRPGGCVPGPTCSTLPSPSGRAQRAVTQYQSGTPATRPGASISVRRLGGAHGCFASGLSRVCPRGKLRCHDLARAFLRAHTHRNSRIPFDKRRPACCVSGKRAATSWIGASASRALT